ncbi:pyruvate, phosphate dikinase [Amycolatopsis balhimycina DSM 5908]|uniref:Pyruvate, phosphate dikinase n=1 Tax=Amycolatopsis balhimycina DSM 5908 TaxID=1081091 RepID=A0A428WP82_AMYBA|nr:PEP/pyruvate-binding domain-containing protein [Amycolatopsis balhimycina]RSM44896.1 pyruvate, phosphate dikinase [Amycolatopsis balhimycina DSM 5908]
MDYVLPLSDIALDDVPEVGMKAAVLGDLRRGGFRVPDGFAVTTAALHDALGAAEPGTAVTELPFPAGLPEQVAAALEKLGDVPVAVRSSGVSEDLAGRSFAGMYESYLNVFGAADVLAAVRDCWASGSSERITRYHQDFTDHPARVAVLVQVMVPATAAGVAFSVNPVTGQRDEISVSAVTGLGDRLMSGEATADEWTVRSGAVTRISGDGTVLDASDVLRVADVVAQVAEHAGGPQDMEWAIADGEINVLQARPITGLSAAEQIPVDDEVPEGFWVQAPNANAPSVPMQQSVFLPVFDASISNIFRYTTGGRAAARMINGRVYLSTLVDSPDEQVRGLEQAGARVAAGEPLAVIRRWNNELKGSFGDRIRAFRSTDLRSLDDDGFDRYFRDLVAMFAELHDVYFTLACAGIVAMGELGLAGQELLGFGPDQTFAMVGGPDGDHVPATTGLSDLARIAAANPELRTRLADGTVDEARLAEVDGEFADAFARYVSAYGHRTIGFDITEPTLAEYPGTLLNLVTAQLDRPDEVAKRKQDLAAAREAVLAKARARLAGQADRERFERALGQAEEGSALRDEKVFYAVSAWALFRYATQEIGRRLHAAGLVDRDDDGFYVGLDEGLAALHESTDLREAVRLGRGRHNWALANPGPKFHGQYGMPPSIEGITLSAAAQHVRALSSWSMTLQAPPAAAKDGEGLAGLAASAGRYTGPVRVINGIGEFGKLRDGDVLVCKETTAQWSILFVMVGALVTDQGSLLSHPAIIAREYGVPAVVATGTATTELHDGQLVTVDGSSGRVIPVTT